MNLIPVVVVENEGTLGGSWYDQVEDEYFLPFVAGLMHFLATTSRVRTNVGDQVAEPA